MLFTKYAYKTEKSEIPDSLFLQRNQTLKNICVALISTHLILFHGS